MEARPGRNLPTAGCGSRQPPPAGARPCRIPWQDVEHFVRCLWGKPVLTVSALRALAQEAPQELMSWSQFVTQTEFVWQNPNLVSDAEGCQTLWFEMEIVNALALAEWEEEGAPQDLSYRWRDGYQHDAQGLTAKLVQLLVHPDESE